MNLEQCNLCVIGSLHTYARFLWEEAVGGDCAEQIHDEVVEAPMP